MAAFDLVTIFIKCHLWIVLFDRLYNVYTPNVVRKSGHEYANYICWSMSFMWLPTIICLAETSKVRWSIFIESELILHDFTMWAFVLKPWKEYSGSMLILQRTFHVIYFYNGWKFWKKFVFRFVWFKSRRCYDQQVQLNNRQDYRNKTWPSITYYSRISNHRKSESLNAENNQPLELQLFIHQLEFSFR